MKAIADRVISIELRKEVLSIFPVLR